MLEKDVVPNACHTSFPSVKEDKLDQYNVSQLNCHHCENPFSELELQAHILNCASKNLILKNNLVNEIDSNMLVTENFCARSLPDVVPEQSSFFQKEPFLNNLPQTTKSFMNMEDDKNLDEIDANAFSACMDLINNDKDLERIVQGINSLDQIDNNYLPYIPPADTAENFLSNNVCSDVQNNENPLQDSEVYGKINEVNNYNIDHGCPQLQEKELAVFDFTESIKSQQFTKPQVPPCTEITPTTTSKVSNELSFTDVLKSILTETSPNETESSSHYESNYPSEITNEIYPKSDAGLTADVNHGPAADPASSVEQTNFTYAVENVEQQNIISSKMETSKRNYQYKCPVCGQFLVNSNFLLKKHLPKQHPEYKKVHTAASCRYPMPIKKLKSKSYKTGRRNPNRNNIEPFNHVSDSNVKQNLPSSNLLENDSTLRKGKRKRILKNPQIECNFCGKLISSIYLKKHIQTQHPQKIENSSDLNTNVSESPAIDSASPIDSVTIPSLSPLLEQDFDSSTCLSASDALKKNSSFTVTETSHNSENSDKLVSKTNVKFNFNVIEFSRDVESNSKIISQENPIIQTENALENVMHENIPLEDFNLESKQNFEDKNTFNDVSRTKTAKCHICGKSYHSKGNLSRHIKGIHKMKLPQQNKLVNRVKISKKLKNQFESYTNFQKKTDANVESLSVTAKEISSPASKELAKMIKVPNNNSANFSLTKSHDCAPHPNSKGNLLKAVLQSNFAKKRKLSQKNSKKGNSVQDKQIINHSKLLCEDLPSSHGSLFENLPSSNSELKCNNKTLELVPFEKTLDFQTSIKGQECSFMSNSEVNNELSVSTNLPNPSLNNNSKIEKNSDVKHLQAASSQNLSVHSCEISPISQIISNVSRCHFGGTSNKDNKKEVFEDNSLKLLIPENKDMSTNVITNNFEETVKSKKVDLIESKIYNYDNDKNNIDFEHGLNCDKNDLGMCNQERSELLHKKLSNSTFFSDDSDVSIKKSEEMSFVASLSCKEVVIEKDLKNISQENKSCALENVSLEKESSELKDTFCKLDNNCDLQNIIFENESLKLERSIHEKDCEGLSCLSVNESCETENIVSKNEPFILESSLQNSKSSEIEYILPENESHEVTKFSLKNYNYEVENTVAKNKSAKDKILQENTYEIKNSSPINELCEFENASRDNEDSLAEKNSFEMRNIDQMKELCQNENTSQENKDSLTEKKLYEMENIDQKKECQTENTSQENKDSLTEKKLNEMENIDQKKELCQTENTYQENKDSLTERNLYEMENIDQKEELCQTENTSQENKDSLTEKNLHEMENIDQKKELCQTENTSQENKDSLTEKHSSEMENIDQKKELCQTENTSQKNKDSLTEKHLSEMENIDQRKELCQTENTSQKNKDSLTEKHSSEMENIDQKKELCQTENTSQENKDSLTEKNSYEMENNDKKELYDPENASQENKDSLAEIESHKLESNDQKEELCESVNASHENEDSLAEKESCEMENIDQKEKISEPENKDSLTEKESCEIENIDQKEKLCELENASQENGDSFAEKEIYEIGKFSEPEYACQENRDSFAEKESHEMENGQRGKLCELKNIFQENEDSLAKKESYEMKNIELTNTLCNPNNIMCRLCQQNLDSMEILTKHLKDFHDIPVLKKHVSEHSSKKKSTHSQNIKLSPPKLKLGTNESDSESVSDFDGHQNWSKTTNDTSSQGTPKIEKLSENNLLTVPSPTEQNIQDTDLHNLPSTLEKSFECSNKYSEVENLSRMRSLKSRVSTLNRQKVMKSLIKSKRLSLDNSDSCVPIKQTDAGNEHISTKFRKRGRRKRKSSPIIKNVFPSKAPSQNECKVSSTKSLTPKNICIESSLSEDASFSSINDSIENCKSSYDSSLSSSSSSSSSQNNTVPLNEITINSNFILPNRVSPSVPRTSKKIIMKSKFAGRKLIIKRLKTTKFRKKSKSKLFSRKKAKKNKTFKSIIVTLKEATEVDKFLETHKQPIVKLFRLKANEFDCLSSEKTSSVPYVNCDKINMMPIVKLEKINETVLQDKEQLAPNLLQQDTHECVTSCRTAKKSRKSYLKFKNKTVSTIVTRAHNLSDESYLKLKNKTVSTMVTRAHNLSDESYQKLKNKTVSTIVTRAHNLSDECVEIFDDASADSIQFLKTVTKEEKLRIKPDFCPTPETKPCFVMLRRDEVYHM